VSEKQLPIEWIPDLARPYLCGYRFFRESKPGLLGYWAASRPPRSSRSRLTTGSAGFFVGYLLAGREFAFLQPQPPECLVFAFVQPAGSPLHARLVESGDGLLRKTFEYIHWLTHRPPRFSFFEQELPTLVRHQSMRDWPKKKYKHLSRNFFIETMAWLVRSGLVRKLRTAEGEPRT